MNNDLVNLPNFVALHNKVTAYAQLNNTDTSTAFAILSISMLLGIDETEAEETLLGSAADAGFDALYIDQTPGAEGIHLFIFHYTSTFQEAKKAVSGSHAGASIEKLAKALSGDDISLRSHPLWHLRMTEVRALYEEGRDVSLNVYVVSNTQQMKVSDLDAISRRIRVFSGATLVAYSLGDVMPLFVEQRRKQFHRKLQVVDKDYFERTDGDIRGLVATVEATQIVEMIRNPSDPSRPLLDIFEDNARKYLGSKNIVNRRILETATTEEAPHFWYLNNGITIMCDSFDYVPSIRAPIVTLYNAQIVNGGQTSNTLFEAERLKPGALAEVLVMVRIYATRNRDLLSKVALSTNSQTPISGRDLHSNDYIQKVMFEALEPLGFFYVRKKGEELGIPPDRRIDSIEMGQALLAFVHNKPEVARKDRGKIFTVLYDSVFSDGLDPMKAILAVRLLKVLTAEKRSVQRALRKGAAYDLNKLFLLDGTYHVLSSIAYLFELNQIEHPTFEDGLALIENCMDAINTVTEKERQIDRAYSQSRFFKDGETNSKIRKELLHRVIR